MSGGYAPGENPWTAHFRWRAIAGAVTLVDLWQLHQRETKGGVPTGQCQCGLAAPCATAEIIGTYKASVVEPCGCSRGSGKPCPEALASIEERRGET